MTKTAPSLLIQTVQGQGYKFAIYCDIYLPIRAGGLRLYDVVVSFQHLIELLKLMSVNSHNNDSTLWKSSTCPLHQCNYTKQPLLKQTYRKFLAPKIFSYFHSIISNINFHLVIKMYISNICRLPHGNWIYCWLDTNSKR